MIVGASDITILETLYSTTNNIDNTLIKTEAK